MIEKDAEKYLDFCHHVEGYGAFSPWLDEYDPFTDTGIAFVHSGSEDNGQFGLGDFELDFSSVDFSYKDVLEKVKERLAECEKDMDPDNADEVTYVEELQELVRSIEDWLSESNESKQSEASGSVIDKQTILDWAEQLNSEQDLGLAATDASLGGKETQYEDDADDKQFDCIKFTSNVFPLTFVEVYSITPDSCSVHVYDGRTNKEVGKATLTDSSDLRTAVVASIKQIYDSVHNQRLVDKAMKLQESLNKGTSMKTESIDDLKDRSVSHGTLRSIDLIPEFLGVLQQYAKDRYDAYVKANPEVLDLEGMDEETLVYVVDELIDELNAVAPEGTYFGSHPGDGSDFGFWTMDESKRKESKKSEVNDDTMVIYKELGTYYTTNKKNYDARIQDANRIQKWDGFDTPQEIIDYCKKYSRGFDPDDVLIVESKKSEADGDKDVYTIDLYRIDADGDETALDDMEASQTFYSEDDAIERANKLADSYASDDDVVFAVVMAGEREKPSGDIVGEPFDIYWASSSDKQKTADYRKKAGYAAFDNKMDYYAKKSEGKDDKDKKDDKSCKGKDCKYGKQAENRGKPQEGPGAGYTVTIKDMTISEEPKISKDGDKFIVEAPVEYEADAEGYDWGSAYIMNELVGTDEGTFPYNPFKGVLTLEVKDSPDIWDVMNDKFFDDVDNPTDEEKISVLKDRFYKGATFNDFEQNYGGGYSHSKFVSEDDVCMQADWDGFNDIEFGGAADGYASGTLTIDNRFIEDIEFASDYGYNRYKLVEAIQQFVKGRGLEMDWSEDTLYDYVAPYVTSDEITDDYVKEILSSMVDSGVEFTDADGNPADLQLESIQGESKKSERAIPVSGAIKQKINDGITQCLSAIKEAGAVANPIKVTNSTDKPELSTRDTLVYAPSYVYRVSGMERNFVGVMFHVEKDGQYGQLFIGWDKKNNRPFVWAGGATFDSYDSFCNDFKRDFSECFKTTESKKSEAYNWIAFYFCKDKRTGTEYAVIPQDRVFVVGNGGGRYNLSYLDANGHWDRLSYGYFATSCEPISDPENSKVYATVKADEDRRIIALTESEFDTIVEADDAVKTVKSIVANNYESKKSESLTLKQKELKDMVRYGKAEDITTLPDEEAKELRKKGIETVGVSRGTYGMNGALLRDKDGNLYAITARSTNLFYFV